MLRYIEGYVQKVNPSKAPQVVGALLDAEASDDFVNNLILSVRSLIPVEQLCAEVEQRNRSARLLITSGSSVHTVAKLCMLSILSLHRQPSQFMDAVLIPYSHEDAVRNDSSHCQLQGIRCSYNVLTAVLLQVEAAEPLFGASG